MAKAKKKRAAKQPRARKKTAGKAGDGRDWHGRLLPGFTPPGSGDSSGSVSIVAAIKRQLKKNRGDRPTLDRILDRYFDLLVKGTNKDIARMLRDGLDFVACRIHGKPAQTVHADLTQREDPIARLPKKERDTVLKRYIEHLGVEGLDA